MVVLEISRTRHGNAKFGNGRHRRENVADSKTMNWITRATDLLNSCEGKFAGVLFLQLAVILMVIQVLME